MDWNESQKCKIFHQMILSNSPIAKMRRIKNYEKMSKEGLITALSKSKRNLAELFNRNFDNDRIRGIKKIHNELKDSLIK